MRRSRLAGVPFAIACAAVAAVSLAQQPVRRAPGGPAVAASSAAPTTGASGSAAVTAAPPPTTAPSATPPSTEPSRGDAMRAYHGALQGRRLGQRELRLEDVRRLLADRKISLELTDAAKDLMFTQGYDPNFGARPLKRAIQKLIQDPLALKILDGEVLHGDHVVVDADKKSGKMSFAVSKRVGEKEPAKAKK